MKKFLHFVLFCILSSALHFSCKNKSDVPDVSDIKVDIRLERFDRDFFSIDTANLELELEKLKQKYPGFYGDFMYRILGAQDDPRQVVKQFITGYAPIYDSLQKVYQNTSWLESDLKRGFQFVKYYFPSYRTGNVILYLGPFDAPGVAMADYGIAVGLQQFAGSNFSVYQSAEAQEMFPMYISRRFSPEYITPNCIKSVVLDLFPDQSTGKPLIEQMVEKGKQWYLLDKFLPLSPDSVKTGYTQKQLDWCSENEGLIWSYLVKNEDLNSINPVVIQTYIGEGPFTQGFPQEYSPGNLGPWIGWQILKKFVSKKTNLSPEEVMKTPAREILDEAKYKPK